MIDMSGIATLVIMGLGAIVALFCVLILFVLSFLMPVPAWVYLLTVGLCVIVSFVIGQRLE